MAKRRTSEQILLDNLLEIPANTWFGVRKKIIDKSNPASWEWEKEAVTELRVKNIKSFIDMGEPFEFSEDFKKIRRLSDLWDQTVFSKLKELPAGMTKEVIERGTVVDIQTKKGVVECAAPAHSLIFFNGKLISIE